MKILHLTHSFFPVPGGTSTRLYNLLIDNKFDFYIVAPLPPSRYIPSKFQFLPENETIENLHISRVNLDEKKFPIPLLKNLKYIRRNSYLIYKKIENRKFDIVHSHNPLEFALAGLMYSKRYGIPLVYETHGLFFESLYTGKWRYAPHLVREFGHTLHRRLERRLFYEADKIIVQTEEMRERIHKIFKISLEKITVIPNGVDTRVFNRERALKIRKGVRSELKWKEKVLLYAGFFDEFNGIDFLLKCIEKFPNELKKGVKLVFIGKGPLTSEIENISKREKWIIFLGNIPYNEMPKYYAACDLFILPRPSNPMTDNIIPLKLLEATAMGIPILASDIPAIKKIARNLKNIILFRRGDFEDFFEKLKKIFIDKIKTDFVQETGKILTWDESREKLRRVYGSLLKTS
jgi:glycosyltransferase involved in cell wall biosynthesis